MNAASKATACRTVGESLQEYARGIAGGLLFSLPLLYTMEVWWAGFTAHPWTLALGASILFGIGFQGADRHVFRESKRDFVAGAVITYAIALGASAVGLMFFGRFDGEMASTCVARTVVLGLPATLGASAGRLLLQ